MNDRCVADEIPEAVASAQGCTVLERPRELPPASEARPWLLAEAAEHGKAVVIYFAGHGGLDGETEALLAGVVTDFLEEAPRRGYRNLVLACEETAPFRPWIERAVETATQAAETASVRFSLKPRRVDLAVVFDQAVGWERGGIDAVVARLAAYGTAAALAVAVENEAGELFCATLSSLLAGARCRTDTGFVDRPPEPGTDLRLSAQMLGILSRSSPR